MHDDGLSGSLLPTLFGYAASMEVGRLVAQLDYLVFRLHFP